MKGARLDDNDRREWVLNDEYLYRCHLASRQPMREFIRKNREEIDKHIVSVRDKPPAR